MRDGMNALNVINGVKQKLAEIKPSLPAGVEVVAGYDRSGLIQTSIETLAARLARRGDHRQLGDHRFPVSLPLGADSNSDSAHRGRRLVHPHVLPPRQFEHHVARWIGARDWRARGRRHRHGRERLPASFRASIHDDSATSDVSNGRSPTRCLSSRQPTPQTKSPNGETPDTSRLSQTSWSGDFLFARDHRGFLPACLPAGGTGRTHVSSPGMDEDAGGWFLLGPGYHACASADGPVHPWATDT